MNFYIAVEIDFSIYRVIAADIDDAKLELAKSMGADIVVNTKNKNLKEV